MSRKANWGFLTSDHTEHVHMHVNDVGELIVANCETVDGERTGALLYRSGLPLWSDEYPSDIPEEYI